MLRVKRILRWIAVGLGSALALTALALGSLYGLAQTEGGRAWLADHLEATLSTPGEFELAIGRLDGPLPHAPRMASVQISDGEGPWLEATAVRLDWRPIELFSGTLWIEAIDVETLHVLRRPATPADSESDSTGFALPSLPVRVVVERLAGEEVALDAPVLGAAASFRVLGEASTPSSDDLRASLLLERSDGTAGRVDLEAHYRVSDNNLKLALSVDEPEGGLIARTLELPDLPAIAARFHGDGPISAWDGHLALDLTGLGGAEADIELRDRDFKLVGATESSRDLPDAPWMLLAGRTVFEVGGRWGEPALLAIDRARLENAAATLALSGTLDLRSLEVDARVEANLSDGRLLGVLIEGAESDRLTLKARMLGTLEQGELSAEASTARLQMPGAAARAVAVKLVARRPLLEPELQVEIEAGSLTAPPIEAEALTARIGFHPDRPLDKGLGAGPIEVNGGARRLLVEGEPELQSLLGEGDLSWELTGRLDPDGGRLTADRLKLASEQATLSAVADVDLANGGAEATADIALVDLTELGRLLGLGVSGRAEAKVAVKAGGFGENLEAELSGQLSALALDDDVAQALLTDRAAITAGIALEPEGRLAIKDLTIESRHARLAGSAILSGEFEKLEADYRLAIEDLGVLGMALGQDLSGAGEAHGTAMGDIDNPRLSGSLVIEQPAIENVALARLDLDYNVEGLVKQPRGQVAGKAETPVGQITGQSEFRLDGRVLHLSALNIQAGDSDVGGLAAISLDSGLVTAQAEARVPDLAPWLDLAGLSGNGGGTAQLALSAAGDRQTGELKTKLRDLSLSLGEGGSFRAGDLAAQLESADLLGEIQGTVALTAADIVAGDIGLESLSLDATGRLAAADYRIATAGQWLGPLALKAEGHLAVSDQQVTVDVAEIKGELLGHALKSRQGFQVVHAPGAVALSDLDLSYGEARITASARLGPDQLLADLAAANLSLTQLEPLWPVTGMTGLVAGELKVEGPATKPTGRMTLSITDLKADAVSQAPPGQLALAGDWQSGRLALEGSIKGLAEKDAAFSLDLPLRLDPATFIPETSKREAVSGRLTWQGDIAELWPLVPITGHDLAGLCDVDLALDGSLASPRLSGRLALKDGAYESFATGTLLRGLDLDLQLDGQRVVLNKLEAQDGASGSLSARGQLELDPERDYPAALSGSLSEFTLVRLDDVTAAAQGELSLAGSLHGALLEGKLETRGVEIRIPDRLPPQVVELEVIEAGKESEGSPAETGTAGQEQAFELSLDLGVTMPKRVFLRGRGLDSEWAGSLDVGGTAELPEIKGKLTLVRGQISVIGRTFKLEQGTIEFLGGEKIDPLVDVKAVSETKDLTATVRVSGPASNPQITISSTPELPQDEIVSHLLFGRGTAELSALEAVQLAAAVADLSGGGASGGVLDFARGKLGVDVLRIESAGGEDDATGAAVAAGKYLRDDVYVGVSQGTTVESGAVEVEVELTPNISIESKVGQTGESDIGVKFKWDY